VNEEELKNYLYIAKGAAKKAGLYLINNADNTVLLSTDKDIKLKADISAEKIIKDILVSKSNIPILAEESGLSSQSSSEIFWVVDPLDGTANYLRGLPLCCVSIALMQNYKPILGVIYDFNSDSLFEGSTVSKAYMNGEEISVSRTIKSSEGVLLIILMRHFLIWLKIFKIGEKLG
jgi:myo-inositol-1(or 4)-monophosphatase